MNNAGITLLGLGPGDANLITRQAWKILERAQEVFLRTRQHPAVSGLPEKLILHSFDEYYETNPTYEKVYERIVRQVLELGCRPQGVIYAVPGHPMIGEATSPEILCQAKKKGIPVQVVDGLSFIEPVFRVLGVDPFPNTALIDSLELISAHVPPFPTCFPALIAQIHSKAVASNVKLTLMSLYPDEHPVQLVHDAGSLEESLENLALYQIDRSDKIGMSTSLYLPPLGKGTSFEEFLEVVAHLRSPEGCPWDRQQTHQTLRSDLLEETFEALAALDEGDSKHIREELGDMILLILLHAQIAADEGEFTIADVLQGIHNKIIRRHPHVFADVELQKDQDILQNWERLKEIERKEDGRQEISVLSGVPRALPALAQAEVYQERAVRVGFDWPEIQGVLDKLLEEVEEVRTAEGEAQRAMEFGDLLFSVVNLARWYGVDAESSLREANARFFQRFAYIEKAARDSGRRIQDLSLEEMEAYWQLAKRR